ncbi:uncharacterized protein [Lolium perenne]|uniref:uncharacterized protein n=1 Tax=Lolium perenne TaxID=4522 RepID=UPI0021E9E681|nr:uncharacterized protein LOC127295706 [Lolium perenne]
METPPALSAAGGAETLAVAAAEEKAEKRARKRSRYLSSDYDTAILIDDDDAADHEDDIAASPRKGENEDAAALLLRLEKANVATDDLLAALLRSGSSPCDFVSPGPDAGVFTRFFALHRASVFGTNCEDTTATDHHHSKVSAAAPAVHRHGLPNTCGAMAVADGSAGKKQDDAIAMGHAPAAHHTAPANAAAPAPKEAGRKRKKKNKVTFTLDGAAVAGSSAQAQPATSIADGTNLVPNKANKKKARRSSVQGHHLGKPVAVLLDFVPCGNIDPPSKEDLISTFRGFGSLIESESDIGTRHARLVFQSSAAAEAAYSCAHTLGRVTARRLQYLRPPPPAPKIPLTDVKKNLEKMISSLTGASVLGREGALDLAGQMLCLMAKVDKTLSHAGSGPSTAAAHGH